MQIIISAGDPVPHSVIGLGGEMLHIADGRKTEMADGRIVYEVGDCNALSMPRPVDLGAIKGWSVDEQGIMRRTA